MPVVLKLCKFVTFQLNVYVVKVTDSCLHFPILGFSMFNTIND